MKKILVLSVFVFFVGFMQTATAYTPQVSISDYTPSVHKKDINYTYLFPVVTKNCGFYLFRHNPAKYFYIDITNLMTKIDKRGRLCEGLGTYSVYYSKRIYVSVIWIVVFLLGILYFVIKYGFLKRK